MPVPRFRLNEMLTSSGRADPHDTINAKKALKDLGYYEEPDYGLTEFADTPLFEGVKRLQRDYRLIPDGVMNPDGPTARAIDRLLVERRGNGTRFGKPIPTPGATPRTPPGKGGPENRNTPANNVPRRSQPRQNPVAIQRLSEEIKRAAASDAVKSDNAGAVRAAERTADFSGLAWKHALAVNEDGVMAMADLVDFGKQLRAADPLAFDRWLRALASQIPLEAGEIREAIDAGTGKSPEDASKSSLAIDTANQASSGPSDPRPTHPFSKSKQDEVRTAEQ